MSLNEKVGKLNLYFPVESKSVVNFRRMVLETLYDAEKTEIFPSLAGGFLTFSPTWNSMIKTLSIGRMDNFKKFFRNGNSCANAYFSR